jgi:hypothetical protein
VGVQSQPGAHLPEFAEPYCPESVWLFVDATFDCVSLAVAGIAAPASSIDPQAIVTRHATLTERSPYAKT